MSFFDELKRRNVFKVGIAYAVTTWILLQLTDVLSQMFTLPDWAPRLILLILIVGFIPALILAWAFELTADGIKKEKDVDRSQSIAPQTGKKLNHTITILMALAIGYLLYDKFSNQAGSEPFSQQPARQSAEREEKRALTPNDATPKAVASTPTDTTQSIAVLPFTNRSPNPDDAYFTDGIHDDLLTQLAKIKAFSVISRTSVMEYRDTTKNLKQIGQELGVSDIMEGSVQRSGERVRINVQLINATTDKHLWAEIYDRQLTTANLFDIQSEIAMAIAEALHATLTDTEVASVADAPTANVNAYELYLQARRFSLAETKISYQTAIDLYDEALRLDPGFKLAWIGLTRAHITNYWNYGGDPADRQKARQAIDSAKTIDPDFPELYLAEGSYHYWGLLDYPTALSYLDKAIALMPGNAEAYMIKGWVSRRAGRWEAAVASMEKALKLNPRVGYNWTELGNTYIFQHDYAKARMAIERARAIDAEDFWGKTAQARLKVVEHGDVDTALTLTLGAQHTGENDFLDSYMSARLLARRYPKALDFANKWPREQEIRRQSIVLREDWQAQLYYFMGDKKAAQLSARAALKRLQALRTKLGDDYRIYLPEARMQAILNAPEKVLLAVQQAMRSKPPDAVEDFYNRFEYARCYAIAGLVNDSVKMLEPLLSAPSEFSVAYVTLDPAFDGIRESPEFIAMLERQP